MRIQKAQVPVNINKYFLLYGTLITDSFFLTFQLQYKYLNFKYLLLWFFLGCFGFLSDAFGPSLSADSRIFNSLFAVWSLHKEISSGHFK
jgi:hypothetical protein